METDQYYGLKPLAGMPLSKSERAAFETIFPFAGRVRLDDRLLGPALRTVFNEDIRVFREDIKRNESERGYTFFNLDDATLEGDRNIYCYVLELRISTTEVLKWVRGGRKHYFASRVVMPLLIEEDADWRIDFKVSPTNILGDAFLGVNMILED